MKKRILIIGNGAKEYALAKKMSEMHEVFVIPSNGVFNEFVSCIDIREDNVREILDYVLENDIDMTIAISQKAIMSDIVEQFNNNKLSIFAPSKQASEYVYNKVLAKKILYKLRIPTPKFGIFEKNNLASDYIRNQQVPFVIKTNDLNSATVITSPNTAKTITDSVFSEKNKKIIIEDYIYGLPFSFYAITDGYKALPVGSSLTYKHSLEGNGGQLTGGMGACVPNYKLSLENEYFLMDNVIYPTLRYLESTGNPYLGIIGVNGILTDDNKISVLGYHSFMQDCDTAAILTTIDDDLYKLFDSCIIGSFSDEKDVIDINTNQSVSIVLNCKNKINNENTIKGLENLDENTIVTFYPNVNINRYLEYEANNGPVMIITRTASSLSKASDMAYTELQEIEYSGMSYRKDICKSTFIYA